MSIGIPTVCQNSLEPTKSSFFLSFKLLVSLILEHYTRECEFGNFNKIKNKNNTQNNTKKKHKNFWLNFCLSKECPKLLCGLGIFHRRRQTIPMWNSSGGGGGGGGELCFTEANQVSEMVTLYIFYC